MLVQLRRPSLLRNLMFQFVVSGEGGCIVLLVTGWNTVQYLQWSVVRWCQRSIFLKKRSSQNFDLWYSTGRYWYTPARYCTHEGRQENAPKYVLFWTDRQTIYNNNNNNYRPVGGHRSQVPCYHKNQIDGRFSVLFVVFVHVSLLAGCIIMQVADVHFNC